jgi:hypothetical protein
MFAGYPLPGCQLEKTVALKSMMWNFLRAIERAAPTKQLPVLLLTAVTVILLAGYGSVAMAAVTFTLKDNTKPRITIQVGKRGQSENQIDTVSFTVPSVSPGDGTPIRGSDDIAISLELRTTASNPLTAFLTVDSATPLINGQGSTIPTSKISWIANDGDIPSGAFAGTSNQLLVSYSGYVSVTDQHTFYYANDAVYDAGTYNGQVTYTWFVP